MVDVTLLEINLEGAEFTANAPFSGGKGEAKSGRKISKLLPGSSSKSSDVNTDVNDEESTEPVALDVEDGDESSSPPIAPLVALAALVGLALVVKKLRKGKSGSDADVEDLD